MAKKILPLIALSLLFFSCGPEVIYEKKLDLPDSGWTYTDTLHYEFDITDTSKLYNLFLDINHLKDFSSQNLYVKIHTGFPDGNRTDQVLSIDVFDKIGRWLGDCGSQDCSLNIPIQGRAYFDQIGKHTFTLEQYMRSDPLPGVLSATLKIEVAP